MQNNFIVINNPQKINLDYQVLGKGSPILFLHGGGTDYHWYTDFLELLAQKYTVYTFACPGFGKSSNMNYSLNNFNILIDEFLKSMNLEKVLIVGHSMGAGLAINYASYKDKTVSVTGLVLVSPWIKAINKSVFKMINDLSIQNAIALNSYKNQKAKRNMRKYLLNNLKDIKKGINSLKLLRLIKNTDLTDKSSSLKIPVLGFYSTNDLVLDSEDQAKGLQQIKSAKIFKFENIGHHLVHIKKEYIISEIEKVY